MNGRVNLTLRALLAILLMIGFYALALSIAGALFWLAYALVRYGHSFNIKLLFILLGGGAAVVWGILPRRDHFITPGPVLEPARHPKLFRELSRIATAMGQPMPAEVYLVGDVNAWVARRGGVMGIGSRPVMGLGLPLLQSLTVSQFRGVLAHEFGHFHGGETRLGPWIYTTRAAIGRTLNEVGGLNLLSLPFVLYGFLYLRVTMAISRNQELAADRLSAGLTGKRPLIEGLRRIREASRLFDSYYVPGVQAGARGGLPAPARRGIQPLPGVARGR